MSKEKRSANQLSEMIKLGIGAPDVTVEIRRDHAYGWQPKIFTSPMNALGFQRRAEDLARVLRFEYDLQE
jgi:hypothetical protein